MHNLLRQAAVPPLGPLLHSSRSLLLIIDVQSRLVPHVHAGDQVVSDCRWLMGVAREVGVPIRVTEHCAAQLGASVPTIATAASPGEVLSKDYFSCWSDPVSHAAIEPLRCDQIVIAGMEAHVCVMQSALEIAASGRAVFVVADAVGSQRVLDRDLALERMRAAGVHLLSREMVLFEWARRGATPLFKTLHREYLQKTDAPA